MDLDGLQKGVEGGHLPIRTWSAGDLLPPLRLQSRKQSPKLGLESSLVTKLAGELGTAAIWEPSPETRQPYPRAVPPAPEESWGPGLTWLHPDRRRRLPFMSLRFVKG